MTTDIIETAISDYEKTMEEYKEQEEELVEYFNNGVIYNYQALDAYIEHIVDNVDLDYYYPKDSSDKSMYRVNINPSCVRLKHTNGECLFTDYPMWKDLK
jgi:hypothetical protein